MEFFNWETWGWISAFCFGVCAIPQALKSYKNKHARGVSWGLLIFWALGEIFATIYILPRVDLPLLVNYILNMMFISIIIYYKLKGSNNDRKK